MKKYIVSVSALLAAIALLATGAAGIPLTNKQDLPDLGTRVYAQGSESVPESVILGGNTIGIRIFLKGVLVVGISEFQDMGRVVSPAREGGIREGDIITHVNGGEVQNTTDLGKRIADSGGEIVRLTIERDGKKHEKKVKPIFREDMRDYKIGAWVKDSSTGIGTLTFIGDDGFGALGHGVSDAETGERLVISEGEMLGCTVTSIEKSQRGAPGEIRGVFNNSIKGEILSNVENGIYGLMNKNETGNTKIPVASHTQVNEGPAQIVSNIIDGKTKKYSAEIVKVMPNSRARSKGMVIKITDEELLNKTGGIVQGMSGSPIIQNGKLVGAVTHVFVNDPTRGYGIFIENMLAETDKIK